MIKETKQIYIKCIDMIRSSETHAHLDTTINYIDFFVSQYNLNYTDIKIKMLLMLVKSKRKTVNFKS